MFSKSKFKKEQLYATEMRAMLQVSDFILIVLKLYFTLWKGWEILVFKLRIKALRVSLLKVAIYAFITQDHA